MSIRSVVLLVVGLALAGGLVYWNDRSGGKGMPAASPAQGISWTFSYQDGLARAKTTGKPMLIHFHGPG